MSHHIYHTKGIILSSLSVGESNRFYKIFTEDLGLVSATAQSVREAKSKLRYSLQDFSFVEVDLVRGKEVWRITSAGEWLAFPEIKKDTIRTKLFARVCSLAVRLLQGEGREAELFTEIVGIANFLENQTLTPELVLSFETLSSFRILSQLGYIDPVGYENFLKSGEYSVKLLQNFTPLRQKVVHLINTALKSSHL